MPGCLRTLISRISFLLLISSAFAVAETPPQWQATLPPAPSSTTLDAETLRVIETLAQEVVNNSQAVDDSESILDLELSCTGDECFYCANNDTRAAQIAELEDLIAKRKAELEEMQIRAGELEDLVKRLLLKYPQFNIKFKYESKAIELWKYLLQWVFTNEETIKANERDIEWLKSRIQDIEDDPTLSAAEKKSIIARFTAEIKRLEGLNKNMRAVIEKALKTLREVVLPQLKVDGTDLQKFIDALRPILVESVLVKNDIDTLKKEIARLEARLKKLKASPAC
jgi:hypothetical protein